jgi:hypothetical protein
MPWSTVRHTSPPPLVEGGPAAVELCSMVTRGGTSVVSLGDGSDIWADRRSEEGAEARSSAAKGGAEGKGV